MREILEGAIEFAKRNGSFSIINACKAAKNVCIFGTGRYFEEAFDTWKYKENLCVNLLCDNNPEKWGTSIKGLPCISPDDLANMDDIIVIPLIGNRLSVIKQLNDLKIRFFLPEYYGLECIANTPRNLEWFSQNRILDVYDILADDESKKVYASVICNRIAFGQYWYDSLCSSGEYFSAVFAPDNNEVYLDCGAYIGDTVLKFIEAVPPAQSGAKFREIHAFEVDSNNFVMLEKTAASLRLKENNNNIHCYHMAVWNENTTLSFGKEEHGHNESVSVNKTGDSFMTQTVPAVKIDDLAGNATLIKMDIEGAELNALKGAENTIIKNAPKLTICLYHKLEDFWEIPIYLKTIMPDYKFFVRHHSNDYGGTVLYAYK